MSLFNNKKISIKKEDKDGNVILFIDYHKKKQPKQFRGAFLKDMIGTNPCLVVVDTNYLYQGAGAGISMEDEVKALTKLLDELEISYRKVVVKSDSNYSVLGIPIKFNNTRKVINYIIGFVVLPEELGRLESISDIFNVCYYILKAETDTEELLDKFFSIRGDREELNRLFENNIYNDNFFLKMRICSESEKAGQVEEALRKYQTE